MLKQKIVSLSEEEMKKIVAAKDSSDSLVLKWREHVRLGCSQKI